MKPTMDLKEIVRITKNAITIEVLVVEGKEFEQIVCFSPSLNVSGYGADLDSARKDFDYNMQVFLDDIRLLKAEQRDMFLFQLGWKKEQYKNKNFLHGYVDENGMLQGLEIEDATIRKAEFA